MQYARKRLTKAQEPSHVLAPKSFDFRAVFQRGHLKNQVGVKFVRQCQPDLVGRPRHGVDDGRRWRGNRLRNMVNASSGERPPGERMNDRLRGAQRELFRAWIRADQPNPCDVIHQADHEVPQD
jgi:hypothetical protein